MSKGKRAQYTLEFKIEAVLTRAGVNGLHDMGANVWEWVNGGSGSERLTLGGSRWYGVTQMHRTHRASKPVDTAAVYIGFRCAKDLKP